MINRIISEENKRYVNGNDNSYSPKIKKLRNKPYSSANGIKILETYLSNGPL